MTSLRNVGVLGASGYAGAELLRLLARHPDLDVAWAAGDQAAGQPLHSRYPGLRAAYGELAFCSVSEGLEKGADVLFCALPHGRAAELAPRALAAAGLVVDLSADFRLRDPGAYPAWYGAEHPFPDQLGDWPYGLPELHREELRGAARVAVPGCYPTAALLALAPLVAAGLVATDGIVVDAKSGLSGAGRSLADGNLFVQANENVNPYKVGSHRHTPEIEQELALAAGAPVTVTFTPHLVPTTRGLLATCYATLAPSAGDDELAACYAAAYGGEPFVDLLEPAAGWPATRAVATTNRAQVAAAADRRAGKVVAAAAIDNLVKGAAGQAVQCANLALGLPETAGLDLVPPRTVSTMAVDRRLGVTAAAGFGASGVHCGLKASGAPDLALVVGDPGTVAAGVFTTNQVVAAPVVWSRDRLAGSADARVVVLNSGNANACTGPAGPAAVLATAERAAAELGCRAEQVLVCSTGVIGVPLDVARVTDGVAKAAGALDRSGGPAAAEAIRTTDTVAKQAGTRVAGGATVGGMAKGAAMLAPELLVAGAHATMLAVLTTDAVAEPEVLRAALAAGTATTFNRITVDGAQSTNDTVLLLASGASGARPEPGDLAGAVRAVCHDLAGQLLADAEGGTKVVSVQVGGAAGEAEALAVARRVADSPLVKAAVYGGDPNWGRVLQAAGTAGVGFDPGMARLEVAGGPGAAGIEPPAGPLERVLLVSQGRPTGADASAAMAAREVEVRLHLGGTGPWAEVRTSDLTPEYVRLNSEYTT